MTVPRRGVAAGTRGTIARILVAACLSAGVLAVAATGSAPAYATTTGTGLLADVTGRVTTFGNTPRPRDLTGVALRMPVIAVAQRPGDAGYWMAALDGGVFAFAGAPFYGSLGGTTLNQPVVGMAPTRTGRGYWLVAADGGVFTFGDAGFFGSLGAVRLNQPVAGLVATPTGRGYWLVAADGGVFTFGDAQFFGSSAGTPVAVPVATIAPTRTGRGYWLLDRSGGVRAFGDARSFGSVPANSSLAVGMVATPSGFGYWIATADGTIRAFGDAGVPAPFVPSRTATVGIATPWGSSSGIGLPLVEFLRAQAHPAPLPAPRSWVSAREVALTFDDGPSSYTPQILAVLMRFAVPATFFAIGSEVEARPDLVRAEVAVGMAVGDHSWDHADLTKLPPAAIESELGRAADVIATVTGRRPECFRPPYGATNASVAEAGSRLGLTQILWNVDPSDYLRPGASVIVSRVLGQATGRGLVIGIHDGGGDRSQTVAALAGIIEGLRARGYTFVRLC